MNNLTKTSLNQIQNENLFNLILISDAFFLYRFKIEIKEKKIEYIKINNFLEIDKSNDLIKSFKLKNWIN